MNKFKLMSIFFVFLMVNGIIYQNFYRPQELAPVKASGNIVNIDMRIEKDKWVFNPSRIEVMVGDTVKLKIFNEDSYDHGWAIEAFGQNKRLFPKRDTEIEFVASKAGEFPFYCSVPCGEGHYLQTGLLVVNPAVTTN
ncbi:MAG: hypothetical protein A3A97_00520 [Candidatus Terrybacteria bacterium RIFCSPLOWO2_01_FULL_40_23]|uniref:Cytochrome oxidase subunit II copper A binding domain-containing protein n=1 Tax=Candidatus Terrybacteria bacterium RIFCSPLOWO2_01_FULL_40_23 TaxID=1802366 RepID=A0A1G2PTN9_9BACT|nr:MAG: hypothetical protein A3A97_00520 [Candidatus Terrybacteria bacterium RIFCSPLOWO2_01_FULL_40_23]